MHILIPIVNKFESPTYETEIKPFFLSLRDTVQLDFYLGFVPTFIHIDHYTISLRTL